VGSLRAALLITAFVLVLEAIGGVLTGSVALLADAGHMLTDAGALGIALFAAWLSTRPHTARRSFGYGRAEILAALGNGLLLGGVSVTVGIHSLERLLSPQPIAARAMIAIACVGLAANLLSAWLPSGAARENLNVRAALAHVLGDALGSLSAIGGGLAILFFDFLAADAIAGLLIAALLVANATRLVWESADILLEGAPRHLDPEQIAREACALTGVLSIHDLHIWTVTSGFLAMSAHVDLEPGAEAEGVRRSVHRLLHQLYGIEHTTIQTEQAPLVPSIEPGPPPQPDSA
jgi:cobalt-zinc-cadmium efflux system protein